MIRNVFKMPERTAMIAAISAALAFTPITATPARADEKAGAIAAASILALITAGIIASSTKQGFSYSKPDVHYRPPHRGGRDWPRVDRRKLLPAHCEFRISHGRDRGTYFGKQCLKRDFSYWTYLPARCERHIDLRGRPDRRGYESYCLAQYGYRAGRVIRR
jgi:hypothetical protein